MTKPELNPNDAIYVSKKNFQRKQNVVNGLSNNLSNIVDGRPGPITTLVLYLADTFISLCLRFFYNIIKICTFSFDWVNNMLFGNFKGILPTSTTTKGKVISLKFFRYIMTVLIPPFGILLNKGLYGWFSALVCIIITYVNYLAGIVYAFVVTSRNRYADQYENLQLKKAMDTNAEVESDKPVDTSAFVGTVGFITLFGLVIYGTLLVF